MERVAVRKPLLRPINKQKRLKWAKEHQNWTVEDWKRVLWTDESKFEQFGTRRRVYVWRSSSEKMLPERTVSTVKHGGGSVVVWGCFSFDGVGNIHRMQGKLDQHGYHSIFVRQALPSGKRLIGHGFIMQQDNDLKHTSKKCKDYLQKKEVKGEMKIMIWPSQSPHLNPIELLLDELDRRVKIQCSTSENKSGNLFKNTETILTKVFVRI